MCEMSWKWRKCLVSDGGRRGEEDGGWFEWDPFQLMWNLYRLMEFFSSSFFSSECIYLFINVDHEYVMNRAKFKFSNWNWNSAFFVSLLLLLLVFHLIVRCQEDTMNEWMNSMNSMNSMIECHASINHFTLNVW